MSSGSVDDQPPTHPHARMLDALDAALAEGTDVPAWTHSPDDLRDLLSRAARFKNQYDAFELQLLRAADRHQVGDAVGSANTAGWWATTTRTTKPAAHRAVALAEQLDDSAHEPTAAAMSAGAVSVDQAAVILSSVEALPHDLVPHQLRADAERHMVALAEHHDPRELRVLGRKILDVIAPEVAEAHEQAVLEREEQVAAAAATFVMHPDGQGSMVGRFKIPVLAGEILEKHLTAIAAPRHQASRATSATRPRVARPLRLGQAFTEYVETRSPDDTPQAGGLAATVVVTMSMENLIGGSQRAAVLDTGAAISASEARRLACEAGLIPAVLGSPSQPLDLGRKTRFHTGAQRHALALRDKGCNAAGCDWPPGMCHAHHPTPWAKGGCTSVRNGMLLCPRHHTLAHDGRYQLKSDPSGRVTFSRRT
ncbi:HNH endonuclease [Nocardioides marmoriginsengisoli]|uniref:HNH endonuclease n=1 Tax=Nocardioides marmoriginsengisoli TaxID=661483 RepID=A0A3N0CNX4_9ACTN|nr:HNH endonuclease signature motif containing protein [Nocardioides marmoriginsengisoli]RNL65177.1 HNH endonuclease [Nocardioides marmoriginsengisoli]